MATRNPSVSGAEAQVPPVVSELEAIFNELPDEDLLNGLKGPKRRGRPGYEPQKLWRSFVAYYYLGLASVSDLLRILHDNPYIAEACGFDQSGCIPSQPTFSRFWTKLSKPRFALLVKNVLRKLTRKLHGSLPDFGSSVAIDSTDIKAWSNGRKKGKKKKGRIRRQKARVGMVSDPDAGWCVKTNTEGNKKYVWGYKVHILADTQYELPLAVDVTAGNVSDFKKATPLLQQARFTYGAFHPRYVVCDAGYSSDYIRKAIKKQYHAEPIIDPNPAHKRAVAKTEKTPEWKEIYNRRTAVERLNGRLKAHRKLNSVRVRGLFKLRVHTFLSVITCQALALATKSRASVRRVS